MAMTIYHSYMYKDSILAFSEVYTIHVVIYFYLINSRANNIYFSVWQTTPLILLYLSSNPIQSVELHLNMHMNNRGIPPTKIFPCMSNKE